MLYRYLLLFPLMLLSSSAFGQTLASAVLDSNFAETGNAFVLHLQVPKEAGSQPVAIDFTAWESTFPAENRLALTPWTDWGNHYTADITLLAFEADTLRLPPLTIRLQGGGQALTPPVEVVILPTPAPDELADMADVEDIRPEPKHWTDYWPWALGGVLVLGVLGLMFWQASRLGRKSRAAVSRVIQLPAHTLALRRLEALTEKRLWQQGEVKAYYAELTHILREYIEHRFSVPALESTSTALLCHLSRTDFSLDLREPLQEVLTQADLAKFAKVVPPAAFHHQAWQTVRLVVTTTSSTLTHTEEAEASAVSEVV